MIRHVINFCYGGAVMLSVVIMVTALLDWITTQYPESAGSIFFGGALFIFGGGMYATYMDAQRTAERKKNAHFKRKAK